MEEAVEAMNRYAPDAERHGHRLLVMPVIYATPINPETQPPTPEDLFREYGALPIEDFSNKVTDAYAPFPFDGDIQRRMKRAAGLYLRSKGRGGA